MPSYILLSFVSCLHFVCKVSQGTSPRSFGGVQLHIYLNVITTRLDLHSSVKYIYLCKIEIYVFIQILFKNYIYIYIYIYKFLGYLFQGCECITGTISLYYTCSLILQGNFAVDREPGGGDAFVINQCYFLKVMTQTSTLWVLTVYIVYENKSMGLDSRQCRLTW